MDDKFVQIPEACYKIGITEPEALMFGLSYDNITAFGVREYDTKDFEIQSHPVTNGQFAIYWKVARHSEYVYDEGCGNLPVVGVTITEALEYASAHGYRLPTSAEWELAARGPHSTAFPWGDTPYVPEAGMSCRELFLSREHLFKTVDAEGVIPRMPEIGLFPEFESAFGVGDLVGCVSEFTTSELDGAFIANGQPFNAMDYPFHMAEARWYRAEIRHFNIGFRCVRDRV